MSHRELLSPEEMEALLGPDEPNGKDVPGIPSPVNSKDQSRIARLESALLVLTEKVAVLQERIRRMEYASDFLTAVEAETAAAAEEGPQEIILGTRNDGYPALSRKERYGSEGKGHKKKSFFGRS